MNPASLMGGDGGFSFGSFWDSMTTKVDVVEPVKQDQGNSKTLLIGIFVVFSIVMVGTFSIIKS